MCESCDAIMINGVYCHEQGCPDAWKNSVKECKWCGQEFKPEWENQSCCSQECVAGYHGM